MSLAVRLVTINVFMFSLFAFQNRHFVMPQSILRQVNAHVLRFLMPVPWAKLGIFAHLRPIYGIRTCLQDLRFMNIALVLASYHSRPEVIRTALASLQTMQIAYIAGNRVRRRGTRNDMRHPALNFIGAYEFFRIMSARFPESIMAEVQWQKRVSPSARISMARPLYRVMLARDVAGWRVYLRDRLGARGWDGDLHAEQLLLLPRSIPQGHRWQMLRLHLNGIYTASRVGVAGVTDPAASCLLCQSGTDSPSHLAACPVSIEAWRRVSTQQQDLRTAFSMATLFFQNPGNGEERSLTIAFFCAIMGVRRSLQHLADAAAPSDIPSLIVKLVECPWVSCSLPTLDRQERRDARVRPPERSHGSILYRSDGVQQQSHTFSTLSSGWGAARWSADGTLTETVRGMLPIGTTENAARYHGLNACFARALERRDVDRDVVFELDSKLIVRQVMPFGVSKYACRSPHLQPLYIVCADVGKELDNAGVRWAIRHIYSEYNQVTDSLAREAAVLGSRDWRPY